jgi:4-amino-4-deoxy-L-arabinose transferase-like glycosyltransferase
LNPFMSKERNQLSKSLRTLFITNGSTDWPLLLLFVFINGLVLYNAVQHHPMVGYDAHDHVAYARILPFHLPQNQAETREFFSPPLPYVIPSLANLVCLQVVTRRVNTTCDLVIGKTGQAVNVFLSLGVTTLLLLICQRLRPDNRIYKLTTLGVLAMLPVYYKTFAQFRGEPYLAFLVLLLLYQTLLLAYRQEPAVWKYTLGLGLTIAGIALSRQWGFFVFPAIALAALLLWWRDRSRGRKLLRLFTLAALIGFLCSGWFYLRLRAITGSFSAFNKPGQTSFSFSNQPPEFYFATGLQDGRLFRQPVRDQFANQLLPTFYSETWGDYWGYMVQPYQVFLKDGFYLEKAYHDPAYLERVVAYLGCVNLVSLLPSLLLLAGLGWGGAAFLKTWRANIDFSAGKRTWFQALLFLLILSSFAGYLWFLLQYRSPASGDTIKASYMIQVFAILPLLAAEQLNWLNANRRRLFWLAAGALTLVFLHNLPAMVTHFPMIR